MLLYQQFYFITNKTPFSKALTFPTTDRVACLSGESELSVLVFSLEELSVKLMSLCLSWKVFILLLNQTRLDAWRIIFSLSFCFLSLFNTSVKFYYVSWNGIFISEHDVTWFRNASKYSPPIPDHFSLFFKKQKHNKISLGTFFSFRT